MFEIGKAKDYNLHIFVNSIEFIKRICKNLDHNDVRTVCSKKVNSAIINPRSINSPVCKINFYTSAAFEGCDIYDENAYTIIISDSRKAHTVLDISTLVVQICGRIRNSKYKDQALMIINTKNHRYCKWKSRESFLYFVEDNTKRGKLKECSFVKLSPYEQATELELYSDEKHNSFYLIKEDSLLKFDNNLRTMDITNFDIIRSVYDSTISVLKEVETTPILKPITMEIKELDDITLEIKNALSFFTEYTYKEVEEIVAPILEKHSIRITKTKVGKYLSNITNKQRKLINGKKLTIYFKN